MSRRARQAEETRRSIIGAALALFAERGYDATPIEDILERSGVSRGSLYYHFPTKEAVFEAVFSEVESRVAERVFAAAAEGTDAIAQLRLGCAAWLHEASDPVVKQLSLVDAPSVLGWQRWREIDEQYGFGLMKAALQAAIEQGALRRQPVDMLAHVLLAALGEAAMVVARSDDPDAAREEARAMFDQLLDSFAT